MEKEKIITTNVISKKFFTNKNGLDFAIVEIEYPNFSFTSGQFVMIRKNTTGINWAYPYMIQKKTQKGFIVISNKKSALYSIISNDYVDVWGANGIGIIPEKDTIFVAEPSTYFLISPLIQTRPNNRLIYLNAEGYSPFFEETPDVEFLNDVSILDVENLKGKVIIALNNNNLIKIMDNANDDFKSRTKIFANTRISCGIGACKGCYLHSKDIQLGIPVCCAGPYLDYNSFDFEKSLNSFENL